MTATRDSRFGADRLFAAYATASYHDDPYPYLAELRGAGGVHRSATGLWLLTRFRDAERILRDRRVGTDPRGLATAGEQVAVGGTRSAGGALPQPITALDPPAHGRVRRVMNAVLPGSLVDSLRTRVAEVVDELLDGLADRKGRVVDLVTGLAYPLPIRIACALFDLPRTDHDLLAAWGNRLAANGDPEVLLSDAHRAAAGTAEREIARYVGQLLVRRRRRPGDDLLSALAGAHHDGAGLSFPELVVNGVFLLVNGYHNTVALIANGVLALLRHPAQLQRLRAQPDLIGAAVEEMLRYDSPIQSIARVTREPVDVAGVEIPAGQQVMALVGAAHRDPGAFDEPDAFRIGRAGPRALSFGGGSHYCIGASLARIEAETAIARLTCRFPDLALAGPPRRTRTFTLRGLESLPVRLS